MLRPGDILGPYRIEREIGRGGAAIVYLAYHLRLERPVALKVLYEQLRGDAGFVERFLFEARAAARLDHPNIVAVYDAGAIDGVDYIAEEYVEGESLADILRRVAGPVPAASMPAGPLPLDFAVSVITQVAAALDYAHQRGIIHRDIKPSNILVRSNGHALLTDFGIARAASMMTGTQTGTVLGTPEYMSPEQAQGRPIDGRSDIYSLAIVAFHMLTGRPPFRGETPQATLYAHVHQTLPDPRSFNPALTPAQAVVLQAAAAKTPDRRYPTATAFAQALATPVFATSATTSASPAAARPQPAAAPPHSGSGFWLWAILGFLVGLAVFSFAAWVLLRPAAAPAPSPAPATTVTVGLVSTVKAPIAGGVLATVTPSATAGTTATITSTPSLTPAPLPAGPPAIAYVSDRTGSPQIFLVSSDGSADVQLTNTGRNEHPFWARDGSLVFFTSDRSGQMALWSMRADGSEQTQLFSAPGAVSYSISPDGQHVAYARPGANGYDLFLDGAEWISAQGDQTRYVWAPDSRRIAFENDGDPRVIYLADVGVTQPVAVTADTTKSWNPSWAPDSQQLALASTVDGNAGIYSASVASGLVRLTPLDVWSQAPAWSPDGGAIAYVGGESDKTWSLYLMQANGGGGVRLHGPVYPEAPAVWSSTGDRLALLVDDGDRELAVIRGDGSDFRLLTNNSANDWDPAWEPR